MTITSNTLDRHDLYAISKIILTTTNTDNTSKLKIMFRNISDLCLGQVKGHL